MKITRKIIELLDSLTKWLAIAPRHIPVRIPRKKERRK